jgi:hypothetical protein
MKVVVLFSSSTGLYSFLWVVVGSGHLQGLEVPADLEDVLYRGLLSVFTRAH